MEHGAAAQRRQRHRRADGGREFGQGQVRRLHGGNDEEVRRTTGSCSGTTRSARDFSDDDNERDPFSFRYAVANNLAPEYNYSDRDQRHRFNLWALASLAGFEINTRASARSAQPKSVGNTPQDRIQPDGSIVLRNTLRKDNEFFTLDIRVGRPFRSGPVTMEPVFEVFNLTNGKNFKRPEVTNLVFNFDGTVQSGLGDPRQVQLGLRVRF